MTSFRSGARSSLGLTLLVLLAVGCGAGATVDSEPVAEPIAARQLPSAILAAAQHHLAAAREAGLAAGWGDAALAADAMVIARSPEAPLLYAVGVVAGDGPAGYVAVDARRAEAPILGWRAEGGLPGAAAVSQLVGVQLSLAPPEAQATAEAVLPANPDWICKTAPFAPHWKQILPHTGPNTNDCESGCGPTAWGNVLAWVSEQAWNGDPKWAPFKNIYRANGSTWGDPIRAPMTSDGPGAQQLLMNLHSVLSTHCRIGGDQGDTDATTAGNIGTYLGYVGLGDALQVDYYGAAGGSGPSLVHDSVCNRQTPAVVSIPTGDIGLGTGFHIAVVTGIASIGGQIYYLFNLGMHGLENGWFGKTTDFYLAGSIEPTGKLPPGKYVENGIRIRSATYGANCSGAGVFTGNATPPIAAACDAQWDCSYTISAGDIGNTFYETATLGDPAPGCSKNYYVTWTCPDGQARSLSVGAEADGNTLALHCPGQCVPKTACDAGYQCGTEDNGCGTSELACGTCSGGAYCENNRCIVPGTNCKADCRHNHDCANLDDPQLMKGCLQALNTCNAQCDCKRSTCASLGQQCGTASDGCGGTLSCGGCASGFACTGGQCVCQPHTCGSSCGTISNGCGGTLACKPCQSQSCLAKCSADNRACLDADLSPKVCTPRYNACKARC